ncbi:MAG: MBG domain-containing protein [Flavobacteriaceae bacterium]|nr:MBG domain-containing protein [Flavobacteriaceae bacterium]
MRLTVVVARLIKNILTPITSNVRLNSLNNTDAPNREISVSFFDAINKRLLRLKVQRSKSLVLTVLVANLLMATGARGQTASATWALTSNANSVTSGNISGGNHLFGNGLNSTAYHITNGAVAGHWNGSLIGASESNGDYYEYTVTSNSGHTFYLSNVSFDYSISSAPNSLTFSVWYSTDNFINSTQIGENITFPTTSTNGNFSKTLATPVTVNSTIKIRVYGWSASHVNNTFRNKTFVISGSTYSCTAASLSAHPSDQTITYGGNVNFSVTGTGTEPLTYQWQEKVGAGSFANISNGSVYAGVLSSTLILTKPTVAMNGNQYRCVVTNSCGSANSNSATLTVNKANQTITVSTPSPASAVYNTTFTVAATASSGLAVAYTSDAPLSNVGAVYTMNSGIGTGVVKYNQAGDDNYNAAPEVTANVAASKASSSITATGTTSFTYNASAQGPASADVTGSTGAVTYSYSGTSNGSVAYGPSATKPTLAGSYSVVATVSADDNFNGKSSEAYAFAIGKAESTIVATGTTSYTYSGSPQGPASADVTGSTGAVTYSYSGTSNGSVAYGPSATKPTLAGSYSVIATLAADDNFNGAASAALPFAIGKAESTTLVTVSQPLTYNGTPQGGTANVTGVGGLNASLTVMYVGTGSTTYASSTTAPTNAGTYSASATYTESANYFGSSDTKPFTIGKATAMVTANNKSKAYGEDNPILNATVVGQIAGGDVINYTLATTAVKLSPVGTYPITVTLGTNPNYNVSKDDGILTVNQATTTTSLTLSAPSVRYMDMLTMTAVIKPLNTATPLTGTVTFTLEGTSPLITYTVPVVKIPGPIVDDVMEATDGSVQAMVINQLPATVTPGSYAVTATFTSTNTNYSDSDNSKSLEVRPRNADPFSSEGYYTGDIFVWTTSETSSTGTVTLATTIKDPNSPKGDVRGAKVTFYFLDGGKLTPIPSAQNLPVGLVDMSDGSVGTASAIVQLNIGNQNAASYTIVVGISGAYFNDPYSPTSNELITVSKPVAGGYITGGGTTLNSLSSGMIKGAIGLKTGFSFDIQFNKKMTNPQGKASITVKSYYKSDGTLDTKLHTYLINSNAIATFAVGQPNPKQASFSSKANLVEQITDEFGNVTIVALEGGAALQLTMTDNGAGSSDTFGVTLQRKAGGIWFSSNWTGTKTIEQILKTGGLYVSTSGLPQSDARTTDPESTTTPEIQAVATDALEVEAVMFNVSAYPNPSTEYFTLKLQGATQDQVQVNVFDVNGRLVYTKTANYNDSYQFGERFQAGVYLVNVQQGTNKVSLKVIKQ